ncbi:hypothetical protein RHGRI_011336 [Rhododendron griersonianum]|uniref:Helicase ATP-binding domain-containing protein n=1 Tax=Rhododendron griersonianum TaxID=479676 RepID=A0AAV6KMF5_9ERIC|nr:hypothetical protein RHGRI_011336 [Rhododendron griersonianum]
MKSTPKQQELLKKLVYQVAKYKGFPLENEFLATLVSIHPWLLKTTPASCQYFNEQELKGLEKYKLDLKLPSKVRFVTRLVPKCIMRKEKVLIFCHNISPIDLFVNLFASSYGWRKGEEVLVLQGKMELFERGIAMDKFEQREGVSKCLRKRQTYGGEVLRKKLGISLEPGFPKLDANALHIVDCMEKIQKLLDHPSVLLMSYSYFMTLTLDDSKDSHKRYLGHLLQQCLRILILDEGHNPKNNKSRLRKALMKVETRLRILLYGTLFQNNFGEYFNTLNLARPRFVDDVLRKLDRKSEMANKGGKTHTTIENRARRLFIDKIARKIDSSVGEERMCCLNLLRNLTNYFIDVYDGGSSVTFLDYNVTPSR